MDMTMIGMMVSVLVQILALVGALEVIRLVDERARSGGSSREAREVVDAVR